MKKRGAALIISLMILTIVFMLGSFFMFSAKSRRYERFSYIINRRLFYIAESGIIKAYHKLKKNSFEHRFYLPERSYEFTEGFGGGKYSVSLRDIPGKSSVLIESTGYLKGRKLMLKAIARFGRKEVIEENNPYYLKRKIYELWRIEYVKE